MKTYIVILGTFLSVFAGAAAQAESFTTYQAAYRAGLEQIDHGEMQAASDAFYQAIALAPKPQAAPDAYLPYVNLSISLYKQGQTRAARDALIQSQVFGVAANTDTGRQLLDTYAAEIMSAPLDDSTLAFKSVPGTVQAATRSMPSVARESDDPEELSTLTMADELDTTNEGSIKRCISALDRSDDNLPWFVYYQCGVDLMKAGEAKLAITALETGANALEDPRRGKRMYGMWYIDYLPYYQMALAYSKLGNWESANAAIESSENYGEFSPGDPDYASFSALDRLIKSNLKHNDS